MHLLLPLRNMMRRVNRVFKAGPKTLPVKAEIALGDYFERLQKHHETVGYRLNMDKASKALNRLSGRFPPQTIDMFLKKANEALAENTLDPKTQTGRILHRYLLPFDPLAIEAARKQARAYERVVQKLSQTEIPNKE